MSRTILVKLQPNQDVTEALEAAAREAGMVSAQITVAVGSLVEAVIEQGGNWKKIAGPGLEVAGLSGKINPRGGSEFTGYICRPDTGMEYGTLIRGMNAVGVTFEVVIETCG